MLKFFVFSDSGTPPNDTSQGATASAAKLNDCNDLAKISAAGVGVHCPANLFTGPEPYEASLGQGGESNPGFVIGDW